MNDQKLKRNLFVYVTFFQNKHFCPERFFEDAQRLSYLSSCVLSLSQILNCQVSLNLISNQSIPHIENILAPFGKKSSDKFPKVYVANESELIFGNQRYDWLLTWVHKKLLKADVESANSEDENFYLCLEDDALFTQSNFDYFLDYFSELKEVGLIPGFIRAEWSKLHHTWTHPDSFSRINFESDVHLHPTREEYVLLDRENPYDASILLDKDLAIEYLNSPSSKQQQAATRHRIICDIGSTAMLGLITEGVPKGYKSRKVVLASRNDFFPLPGAIVRHQGDRYANDPWQRHFSLYDSPEIAPLQLKRSWRDYTQRFFQPDIVSVLRKKILGKA